MNEANNLIVMDQEYIIYSQNKDATKAAIKTIRTNSYPYETVNLKPCPCTVDEVYSMGLSLQDYIGDIYLNLCTLNQGSEKILYQNLAISQTKVRKELEELAKANLNNLLSYFYNNGGQIVEAPVSEQLAKEVQPFFNRIVENFLNDLDVMVNMASKSYMTAHELENGINRHITDMYASMFKLFPVSEIQNAFDELILANMK